ncbi:MAG: hypothetical protein DHS20C09_18940 [marine bacterium B5-7]|nr:MAG: hypothetical protein DHS20C09_18940 [marine bacterium B5-7]
MNRLLIHCLLLALPCLLFSATATSDQDAGETVLKRGQISEDLYVAGGRVDVLAEVIDGDVIAAGGRVAIDSQVTGDVIAAGGSVTVHNRVDDDVRLAGGEVIINAAVGDGAVAVGGIVLLAPNATVGGKAMFSGGRVELAGQVRGDVRIGGGQVVISGQIDGDVELAGKSIVIKPGAVIRGNLTYRSPEAAEIDSQARIEGSISHIEIPLPGTAEIAGVIAAVGVLLWLSIALTGIVLFLLFPQTALSAARTAGTDLWMAMGLGLALFAAIPVLSIILLSTGVGWLLALLLMTVYSLLLLLGFLTGVLFLSETMMRCLRKGREVSKLGISLAFVLTSFVIMIVGLIPLLGALLLLLLLGVGGVTLQLYRTVNKLKFPFFPYATIRNNALMREFCSGLPGLGQKVTKSLSNAA